jgi:hypothetical protein
LSFNSIEEVPEKIKGEKDLDTLKLYYQSECTVI